MAVTDDEKLAQALVQRGVITQDDLQEARALGGPLTQALLRLGHVAAHEIAPVVRSLGEEQVPAAPPAAAPPGAQRPAPSRRRGALDDYEIDPAAVGAIPRSLAEEHQVLPLNLSAERIQLAMADTTNVIAIDAVRLHTRRHVVPVQVDAEELQAAIAMYYTAHARARAAVAQHARDLSASVSEYAEGTGVDGELLSLLDQAPVVRVVETLVRNAVRMQASDIHIEPRADGVQVRYRLDGVLETQTRLPKDMQRLVLSRIKILADENIAETRLPQSGRFEFVLDEKLIDLRVSTLPTFWGEKAVLRLLDKSQVFVALPQLGFQGETLEHLERLLRMPQGLILVTGPTGSGKSTTLYAALHTLNDDTKNITTVEDPIEYEIEGLNQVQVHPRIGLDFAAALREILRQDPDIILVGEIRDLETAQMTFRAAMTGHLVLSTLHTNDAPSAATRLADMGLQPYLVASTLSGVLAQRLVRKICTHCRAPHEVTPQEMTALGLSEEQAAKLRFFWGRGCPHCRNTGYSGRIAVYELLTMNDEIRRALSRGEDASALRQIALKGGMKPLRWDGLNKIHQGITTAQEVISVTFAPEALL